MTLSDLFCARLAEALIRQGGDNLDLSALVRLGNDSFLNLIAAQVHTLAGILRSAVHVQHRFNSADAVITQACFEHGMKRTTELWAKKAPAGAIDVDAEMCLWSPGEKVDGNVRDDRLALLPRLSLRLTTLPELVAYCLTVKQLAGDMTLVALGTEIIGRNSCVFVPCAGMRGGVLRQWWDWRGGLEHSPHTLLVARCV